MTNKAQLLPLQDLINDPARAFKNDQLKSYLNKQPPAAWILTNPFANNSKYMPIDKVELLLDVIFQEWKVEILEVSQLFDSVRVTVRLHYKNPTTGEWTFHDGVGAKALQTEKDTGTLQPDFSNIKKNAVEMSLPIAKTSAVKDAADHIGKLFGRDLNRKTAIDFAGKYMQVNIDPDTLNKGRAEE